jgi:6-phosphofructokinase 1
MSKQIGILTGGGDSPGLNAVIRAVVRKAEAHDFKVVGFLEGWKGVLEDEVEPLDLDKVSGILFRGGTILKTSRTNPLKRSDGLPTMINNLKKRDIHALVAVGGDDTMSVAAELTKHGVNVVGVPKTIDNDLPGTDFCFGFDTAVNVVTEAIDRLHTTAEAHNRVMVVEVMGRDSGWIALYAGIAGGADYILIPEKPFDIDEVCEALRSRHLRGRSFSIVVAAEGARFAHAKPGQDVVLQTEKRDEFGHVRLGGVGQLLASEIEKRTGFETRVVVLGHVQRGGSPSAFDRVLATRFGIAAMELVLKGEFGKMVALQGTRIVAVPLSAATAGTRQADEELYRIASTFFG